MDLLVNDLVLVENARKAAVEWMSTSDSIAREPVYTLAEQQYNDRAIERVRRLTRKILESNEKSRIELYMRSQGLVGKVCRSVGAAALWAALHRWSQIFLSKQGQRLGATHKWLKVLLSFEETIKSFHGWTRGIFPHCSRSEKIKSLRIIWMGHFVRISSDRVDTVLLKEDPLFAYAFLYPMIDDFFDTNTNQDLRREFGACLKERLGYSNPALVDWSSPHPESLVIGKLIEYLMRRFPPSSPNRDLAISIFSRLIDLEMNRTPSDIVFHAACKGGLTLCIMHLLIFDSLSAPESLHLMRVGLALQIVDDLQDIQEDFNEDTSTVATANFYSSEDLRRQYAKAINLIRYLFPQDHWSRKLDFKDGVKRVFCELLSLLCFEAAARTIALQPKDRIIIAQHCPLSLAFLRTSSIESTLYHLVSFPT